MTQQIFMCKNQNQLWVFILFCRAAQLGTFKLGGCIDLVQYFQFIVSQSRSFGLNIVVVRVLKKKITKAVDGKSLSDCSIVLSVFWVLFFTSFNTPLYAQSTSRRPWISCHVSCSIVSGCNRYLSLQFSNILQLCLIHVIFRRPYT